MSAAILAYHSIDESDSVLSTSPSLFARQMRALRESDVRVVPLTSLRRSPAGERAVAITFDDGFRSVYEHALPVLQQHGFPATVFLVTEYMGRANDWPSQPSHIPRWPLLTWSQAREMSGLGVTFGSHTLTHPDLTRVRRDELEAEVGASRARIEDELGQPVDAFAYPYGALDPGVRGVTEAHFRLACSTRLGYVGPGSDPLALERLDTFYLRRSGALGDLFGRRLSAYLLVRRWGRELRERLSAPARKGAIGRASWSGPERTPASGRGEGLC